MEIQSLKLIATNADLAVLLARVVQDQEGFEDLQARFTPEGVVLQGRYYAGFGFRVPFQTLWSLRPAGSTLRVQLSNLNVGGMSANMLQGALKRMIRDAVTGQPGLHMEGEDIVVDLSALARSEGVELLLRLSDIRLSIGSAVFEVA